MAVCCSPSPSLLTAGLPYSRRECSSLAPGHLPSASLCVGMGALLRKAVGTLWGQAKGVEWAAGGTLGMNLSLAWQPLGNVNSHRFGTQGRASPGRFRNEGPYLVQG